MLVNLDARDPRPVFRQIVDEIDRCVATGILAPDAQLPAVRELAAQLKINPNTVQQAYRELERAGKAYVRRGVGTFIAKTPPLPEARRIATAREMAARFLREGFRQGLLASDLLAALHEIAPGSDQRPASIKRPATSD